MRLIGNRSLTLRLTLFFAMASSAALLIVGISVRMLVEKHFEEQDVEELSAKMQLLRADLQAANNESSLAMFGQNLHRSLSGHEGLFIRLQETDGRPLFDSSRGALPRNFPEGTASGPTTQGTIPYEWVSAGVPYRAIMASLPTQIPGRPAVTAIIAMDSSLHHKFMESFSGTLWRFVAAAAILTGLLGWVVARQGLKPLRAMRERAEAVTATRLDQRLPVDSVPRELAELAHTLNEMLGRLEEAFRRISDFSSDLAHELRTPISALMTQTQVTISRRRSVEEYESILASNAEEFERLAKMISDMLFLAKAEHGLVVPNREGIDLAREIDDLFDFYELIASERDIALERTGNAVIVGDRIMLRRALSNLLSNAIHHSRESGVVVVSIAETHGEVTVRVSNSGKTIPSEHLDRIFDRFYRVDPSRQRHREGSGLGLPITKSIILAHAGTISAHSLGGTTTFLICLPKTTVLA